MTSTSNYDSWTIHSDGEIFIRCQFACDVSQDRYIVVAGGNQRYGMEIRSAAIYDVTNNSYFILPYLPYGGFCRGVIMNNYFYVAVLHLGLYRICLSRRKEWEHVDGWKRNHRIEGLVTDGKFIFLIGEKNLITSFDPINNTFRPITYKNHSMDRYSFSNAVVQGKIDEKIYIMRGTIGSLSSYNIVLYDITTQSWTQTPPLPTPLYIFAAVVIDRWILVTGEKYDYDGPITHNVLYDTQTQLWTKANTAFSKFRRGNRCYVKVGSYIITVGGYDVTSKRFPMTAIHIKDIIPGWRWESFKTYILLRKLVDEKRAAPINLLVQNLTMDFTDANFKADVDKVVQKVFTDLPLDIFRYLLPFL